jgi:hypothetical protein
MVKGALTGCCLFEERNVICSKRKCPWMRRRDMSLFCQLAKAHDLLFAPQLHFCGLQLLTLFGSGGRISKF